MVRNSKDDIALTRGLIPYAGMALLILVAYVFSSALFQIDDSWIRVGMIAGVTFCVTAGFLVSRRKDASARESLFMLIILAGMIMRIGYMLYTRYDHNAHDAGEIGTFGHVDYIYTLFSTGNLPDTNRLQFYQPPFAHMLMALVVKICSLFLPNASFETLLKSAQLVPCFASCALMLVMRSLSRELNLSPRASLLILALVAAHPTFYLLSASINNDALMIFLYMVAVLYTIRWYREPSLKNILLLAVSIGLGMMTKLSAVTVAFFTAPVFLIVLIQHRKECKTSTLWGQFIAFGAVSFSLGLWYPARNFLKFRQMPNYIFQLPRDSDYFSGWADTTARFLSFSLKNTWPFPIAIP